MTIPELLRHIIDSTGKAIPKLLATWPFQSSMKTLYNRANNKSPMITQSCDIEILAYAWQNGFATEALAILANTNEPLHPFLRAAAMFPDLSFGEVTAIEDVRRVSPGLVLTDEAIRGIVERRRHEVASSTFPGS